MIIGRLLFANIPALAYGAIYLSLCPGWHWLDLLMLTVPAFMWGYYSTFVFNRLFCKPDKKDRNA